MIIAHLNTAGNNGSIPNLIYNIDRFSDKTSNYLIYANKSSILENNRSFRVSNIFLRYYNAFNARLGDCDGFVNRRTSEKIVNILAKLKPDIVHIHNLHGYWLDASYLIDFLKRTNANVVWTLHDYWLLTGRCAHFEHNLCGKWKSGCGECNFLDSYPATLKDNSAENFKKKVQLVKNFNAHFVLPSKSAAIYFDRSFLSNHKRTVIYNGIDLLMNEKCNDKKKRKKKIGAVASKWTKQKGIDDIKRLSCLLPKNYFIELVGIVPREHFDRRFDNIRYKGEIKSPNQLRSFYQSCDVIFNPSQVETFGLIPIEAISQKTPVVAYRHEVFKEIYHDFNFVRLVENSNCQEAMKEICLLAEYQPKKKEWLNEQAKLKIFSATSFAMSYQNLYIKLIEGN